LPQTTFLTGFLGLAGDKGEIAFSLHCPTLAFAKQARPSCEKKPLFNKALREKIGVSLHKEPPSAIPDPLAIPCPVSSYPGRRLKEFAMSPILSPQSCLSQSCLTILSPQSCPNPQACPILSNPSGSFGLALVGVRGTLVAGRRGPVVESWSMGRCWRAVPGTSAEPLRRNEVWGATAFPAHCCAWGDPGRFLFCVCLIEHVGLALTQMESILI